MFPLCSWYEKNDYVQLPVILRIFEENQNPMDMHTSITRINILQTIEAVAQKLWEDKPCIYIRTDERTNGRTGVN
jgi:hypothetical protein